MASSSCLGSREGLCQHCWDMFHSLVVNRTPERRTETHEWYDINSLRSCATRQCRFCALVTVNLNKYEDDEEMTQLLTELAKTKTMLGVRLMDPRVDGCEIYVMAPLPKAQHNATKTRSYAYILAQVSFRIIKGKKSPAVIKENCMNIVEGAEPVPEYELSSGNTESAETFHKIRTWLQQCETHDACCAWQSTTGVSRSLPTRLVKISSASSPNPRTSLVLREDFASQSCQYATPSHCWGEGLPIKLLRENLDAFQSDIPWGSLPATFQDTVLTLQRLDIEYVWIDALCIIQDSEEDWVHEAATMKDVYANCYLNISADASENSRGGLFRDRNPELERSFIVCPQEFPEGKSSAYCCYIDRWFETVELAPLKGRAWVLQERFLSPRVVHFSRKQVHWECCERLSSESLPDDFSVKPLSRRTCEKSAVFHGDLPITTACIEDLYTLWSRILESYGWAQLSFPADRSVAISGLAGTFCYLLRLPAEDYICGLWRPKFIQQLMWCTYTSKRRVDSRIPSWSWLSVDADISNFCPPRADEWRPLAELVKVTVMPHSDPFGQVLSGRATVRAKLCQAVLSLSPRNHDHNDHDTLLKVGQHLLRRNESFFLRLDEEEEYKGKVTAWAVFLLLGGGRIINLDITTPGYLSDIYPLRRASDDAIERVGTVGHYDCLILVQDAESQNFRRVGFISFDGVTAIGWKLYGGRQKESPESCSKILDECFLSKDIPEHLYKDLDENFMYTVTLV